MWIRKKIGRQVCGIDVLPAGEGNKERLDRLAVQEVVFAVKKSPEERAALYDRYKSMGFKVKVYTFPVENTEESGRRQIREFDVEELLFRQEVDFLGEEARSYYRDKVVLVSGGGGSIGSELSRQIARMHPQTADSFGYLREQRVRHPAGDAAGLWQRAEPGSGDRQHP